MIIFASFLTTFEEALFFETARAVAKIGLSPKLNDHEQIQPSLACLKTLCISQLWLSLAYFIYHFMKVFFTFLSKFISENT